MAYTTECASREYFERTHIPEILQAISCGLAYCKPDDVLEFMEDCIRQIREKNMLNSHIPWDAFIPKGVLRPTFGLGKFSSLLPPIQNIKTITPIPLLSSIPKNTEIPIQDDIFATENMKFKNYLDPIPQVLQQKSNRKGKKWENVIFVIGGPCSGVTSQCKNLSENLDYEHISVGDIVNSLAQTNNSRAKLIKELYDEANALPINFIIEELKNAMDKIVENKQGFLIDGFPEYLDQAILFEKNIINCKKVLYIECSEQILNKRVKENYPDISTDVYNRKFYTFYTKTLPVIDYYENQGKVIRINGNGELHSIYSNMYKIISDLQFERPVSSETPPSYAVKKSSSRVSTSSTKISSRRHSAHSINSSKESLSKRRSSKSLSHSKSKLNNRKNSFKNVFFVIGGPGSGKGTQCDKIIKDYGLAHLSTGDMLRAEVEKQSEIGKTVDGIMKAGKMVPEDIIFDLIKDNMKNKKDAKGFLIDGFPRNVKQAKEFEEKICKPNAVLYFNCDDETLKDRLLERGKTSGRADDNIDTILNRLETYRNVSMPVVDMYKESDGDLIHEFDASKSINEVYDDVKVVLDDIIKNGSRSRLNSRNKADISDSEKLNKKDFKNLIFVLGGPGSGKGTQCDKIIKDYKFAHFSVGDLLRDEVKKGSEIGQQLDDLMKEGKIVPAEITFRLLKKALLNNKGAPGYLIDGFPRSLEQALEFENSICKSDATLFFNCPLDILEQRLLERGKTSGRADDNIDTIKKRFKTFEETSMPVIDYFRKKNKVEEIDSTDTIDNVYEKVKEFLDKLLHKTSNQTDSSSSNEQEETLDKKDFKNLIYVLGGPGSGKGTQCDKIIKDYKFAHFSVGDLLRDEVKKGSEIGQQLDNLMKEGKIVPADITFRLLKKALLNNKGAPGYLIDGFPRSLEQALEFENSICKSDATLFFNCPLDILEQRLLERGKTSGRADDNIDTIKKRFKTFEETSMPVIDYFRKKNKVEEIDSTDTIDNVYEKVKEFLDKLLHKTSNQTDSSSSNEQEETLDKKDFQNLVYVLGGPGSGKGTQCDKIIKDYKFAHFSVGDLLRDEVKKGSEIGQQLDNLMKEGKIVPAEITFRLLKKALLNNKGAPGYLIDGFPRSLEQALEFENSICKSDATLFFNCPLDILEQRLLERGKTSGRADDNIDTIKKRFKTFEETSMPVIDYFRKKNKVEEIDSTDTIDNVYEKVKEFLDKLLHKTSNQTDTISSNEQEETLDKKDFQNLVYVLGGPGSGKGTQCDKIIKDYKFAHFSVGDLLRDEVKSGSEIGKQVDSLMKEGKIVPTEVTFKLLKNALKNNKGAPGYLIDGFPRSLEQAIEFENTVCKSDATLFFKCPLDILEQRLLERGKTSGRADDNIDTIKKRFKTFEETSMPVIDYFKKKNKVEEIDSTDSIDNVYEHVKDFMDKLLKKTKSNSSKEDNSNKSSLQHSNSGDKAPKKSIICVVGKPGAGQSKVCQNISSDFPVKTLVMSEVIENEIISDSKLGQELQKYKENNTEPPKDLLVEVIKQNIDKIEKENDKQGIVIDGFPESLGHTLELENAINDSINLINLNVSDDKCKENYINDEKNKNNPNVLEEFQEKLDNYNSKIEPLINYYKDNNPECYNKVDANKPFDNFYDDVKEIIPEILTKSRTNSSKSSDIRSEMLNKNETNDTNSTTITNNMSTTNNITVNNNTTSNNTSNSNSNSADRKNLLSADSNLIFVLGGPGSGKGTQCDKIVDEFGLKHLSTGDMLREEVKKGTELGNELNELMKEGKMVPQDLVLKLVKQEIDDNKGAKGFLIDGFPRTLDQARAFEDKVGEVKSVLYFNCPPEVLEERLLERGKTSGRADDNIDTIKKRLETYENMSKPAIEYYKKKGKLSEFDANPPVEEVYKGVRETIKSILNITDDNSNSTTFNTNNITNENNTTNITNITNSNNTSNTTNTTNITDNNNTTNVNTSNDNDASNTNEIINTNNTDNTVSNTNENNNTNNSTTVTETITSNFNSSNTNTFNITNTTTTTTTNDNNTVNTTTTTTTQASATSTATASATVTKTTTTTTNGNTTTTSTTNNLNNSNNSAVNSIKDNNEGSNTNNDPILDETLKGEINIPNTEENNNNNTTENPLFNPERDMLDSEENIGPDDILKNKKRYKIVFALGGPGSGKKNQTKRLADIFKYELLSTGDILRNEVASKGPYADEISSHIDVGELVPDEIVNELIKKIISEDSVHYKFIIEGYPRTVKQAEYFEKTISPFKFILYFKCSDSLLQTRFHHQLTESRIDLSEDIIVKRMEEYANNTQKTIEYFAAQNRVKEVSLERTDEEIATRAKQIFVEYDNSGSYEEYQKK